MNADTIEKIKSEYYKLFPKNLITCYKSPFGGYILNCFIVGNKDESINGIIENDLINVRFSITDYDNPAWILEFHNASYKTKPTKENYVYGRGKIATRKTTGEEKIIEYLKKFFKKLYDTLKAEVELNNIPDKHAEILKQKIC